jgi:hypothetical protein
MAEYIKMSELVGSEFTVEKVWGFKWKFWDNEARKMLVSDEWVKDYRKIYGVTTDKGSLDVSQSQFASMLEGVSEGGKSDVVGKTYTVKSNGETGKEIRYFINPVFGEKKETDNKPVTETDLEDINALFS